jgi:hypothetical protein
LFFVNSRSSFYISLLHQLSDILTISVLAVIAGGNGWEDMALYGLSKYDWLSTFLPLPNGIPSPDTFVVFLRKFVPTNSSNVWNYGCNSYWMIWFTQFIAIDGKETRGSYDREAGTKSLHLLSAWSTQAS